MSAFQGAGRVSPDPLQILEEWPGGQPDKSRDAYVAHDGHLAVLPVAGDHAKLDDWSFAAQNHFPGFAALVGEVDAVKFPLLCFAASQFFASLREMISSTSR